MIKKAVLYILRKKDQKSELLVFDHPLTKHAQVIRGTVNNDESPEVTVIREAKEEAGLVLSHLNFLGLKILSVPGMRNRSGPLEWSIMPS